MGFPSDTILVYAFLLIFSIILRGLASASDTITSSQSIRDLETLTSSDSVVKLGFFSPENSTHRYVGIWYLYDSNVIWVANRNQPLLDSSGVLRISEDGNLVVLDGKNQLIWSSNVSNAVKANSTAQLLRSGNLVLQDDTTGQTIWESFKHPCDAAVPSMRVSANRITGEKMRYISWKSASDPSTGYFSATLERLDAPELFIWKINGTRPYWRSGPWNGRIFIGMWSMSLFGWNTEYRYGWSIGYEGNGTVYITSNFTDPAAFFILTLTAKGQYKLVKYSNRIQVLNLTWEHSGCEIYGTCGAFGSCNTLSSPICSCLNGYEPRNPEEWSRQNWTGGCVRKEPFRCERLRNGSESGQEDEFLKLEMMKVPDFVERLEVEEGQCGTLCLKNCSCLAYAYDPGIGCMYWSGNLLDLRKFSNAAGLDLYIRLAYSEFQSSNAQKHSNKSREKRLVIGITVAIGMVILAICVYLGILTYHSRKGTAKHSECRSQRMTEIQKQVKLDDLPLFDFEVVATATNNFHSADTLGKGGFGPVYKGLLPDGQEIAVKRLAKSSGQGLEQFMNEVVVISKLQHRNLVKLLGCCIGEDEKILIYEFMPNKSLDAFIFDPIQRKNLDWTKRFSIIEGIAQGLLYLHRDSRLRIIHRDLKASNILLDENMNPKISDFGLAKMYEEEDEVNTRRIVGTYGYMPPEYAMHGLFSEKTDVYSFGVLLLEIISGKGNTTFNNDDQFLNLIGFAWNLWKEDNIRSLIDPEISASGSESHILRCIHIAFLCVQKVAKRRPTMATVVLMLNGGISRLPPPKQVAFVQKQYSSSLESPSQANQCNSNNNVTLSEILGRYKNMDSVSM